MSYWPLMLITAAAVYCFSFWMLWNPSVEIQRVSWPRPPISETCSISIKIRPLVCPLIIWCRIYSVPPCCVLLKKGEKLKNTCSLLGGPLFLPRTPLFIAESGLFPHLFIKNKFLESKVYSKYALNLNNACVMSSHFTATRCCVVYAILCITASWCCL
jgi:hypothetical protein